MNMDNCPVGHACNLISDVCEAGPVTVMFQNDGTYAGAQDTGCRAGSSGRRAAGDSARVTAASGLHPDTKCASAGHASTVAARRLAACQIGDAAAL